MLDVVVRSEATIVDGDGVAGVFCRENPDTDAEWQWYKFVARDGFAAIRLADLEGNLETLAKTDDVSLPTGEPIAFEAACVDGTYGSAELLLSLNGSPVLHASDDDPSRTAFRVCRRTPTLCTTSWISAGTSSRCTARSNDAVRRLALQAVAVGTLTGRDPARLVRVVERRNVPIVGGRRTRRLLASSRQDARLHPNRCCFIDDHPGPPIGAGFEAPGRGR